MPAIKYVNSDGDSVPGVTTVLNNLGWKAPGITWWAWNEGKAGRDFMETLDAAATAGTLAHAMIESDLKTGDVYIPEGTEPEIEAKAQAAFDAWLEWKSMVKFELIASELSCVSELHQFGGTIDIALVMGNRRIIDIKTSKAVYADHKIQVAAYMNLYNECYPDKPVINCHILQLGKEDGSFSHHFYKNLDAEWTVFKHLLEIHRLKKVIGK